MGWLVVLSAPVAPAPTPEKVLSLVSPASCARPGAPHRTTDSVERSVSASHSPGDDGRAHLHDFEDEHIDLQYLALPSQEDLGMRGPNGPVKRRPRSLHVERIGLLALPRAV